MNSTMTIDLGEYLALDSLLVLGGWLSTELEDSIDDRCQLWYLSVHLPYIEYLALDSLLVLGGWLSAELEDSMDDPCQLWYLSVHLPHIVLLAQNGGYS